MDDCLSNKPPKVREMTSTVFLRSPEMAHVRTLLGSSFIDLLPLSTFLLKRNHSLRLCSTAAAIKRNQEENVKALPSLPVQPLEQMLEKYVKSIMPFVNSSELSNTKRLVKNFCEDKGKGIKLQELLNERARNTENWLSDWWLNVAYLEYRNPVVVYSSPGLVWPKKYLETQKQQLNFTTRLIKSALNFNELIENNNLPQEIMGKNTKLCMSQYSKLFTTCRIPDTPRDRLALPDENNPSQHIIVIYNNHFFSVPVFVKGTREQLSHEQILVMLQEIVATASDEPGVPVGVLTTWDRDNWAKAYKELQKDPVNRASLEAIEKSLFVVCLEKPLTKGGGYNYDTRCSLLLLHGFGSKGNVGNRWYDKTLQFVVGAEGDGIGIAYEHSAAEGGPIGMLTDHILDETSTIIDIGEVNTRSLNIKKLEFHITNSVATYIRQAEEAVDRICNDLDVYSWVFPKFGKEFLKTLNVSPDSFIQVAIQLAFFKVHNHPGAQYESGSLRRYLYGRTDTIRSCSVEVVNMCENLCNSLGSTSAKAESVRDAINAHKNYANDVINGCGVDRHLLALKLLAKEHNIDDGQLFTDPAFQRSTHFQLSTSNVPMKKNGMMVYGPLVENGYACCYNPRPKTINFGMSAWASSKTTRLVSFKEALESSLEEMRFYLTGIRSKF
ncbi:hypothetical protein RUM44_007168 [Polyplax serrata]|uniref:Choline/carnitine acyltransferase domain-containing protein n=1 Tax=Polyplax serrata TaxID=468196 RepID=A0ABR1AZZ6_POLSC